MKSIITASRGVLIRRSETAGAERRSTQCYGAVGIVALNVGGGETDGRRETRQDVSNDLLRIVDRQRRVTRDRDAHDDLRNRGQRAGNLLIGIGADVGDADHAIGGGSWDLSSGC